MLLNVAQAALEHAGWPTKVLTGRNMFDLGKNTCNFGYWGSSNAVIKSKIVITDNAFLQHLRRQC